MQVSRLSNIFFFAFRRECRFSHGTWNPSPRERPIAQSESETRANRVEPKETEEIRFAQYEVVCLRFASQYMEKTGELVFSIKCECINVLLFEYI